MAKYYVALGTQRLGPFELEELPSHNIEPSTLVWRAGFSKWVQAGEVPELQKILPANAEVPPPMPHQAVTAPSKGGSYSGATLAAAADSLPTTKPDVVGRSGQTTQPPKLKIFSYMVLLAIVGTFYSVFDGLIGIACTIAVGALLWLPAKKFIKRRKRLVPSLFLLVIALWIATGFPVELVDDWKPTAASNSGNPLSVPSPAVAGPGDMFKRGLNFLNGQGVHQDNAQAMIWFRKAADAGNSDAMYNVGVGYEKGEGVAQDYGEAMRWFQKAADGGNAQAMYNLGVNYDKGQGVAQDLPQAMEWYRKAADAGDASAMYNLGVGYDRGEGVPHDDVQAAQWYRKASDAGNGDAMFNLSSLYAEGRGVPQDNRQALQWNLWSAEAGSSMAMFRMGQIYESGIPDVVSADPYEAVRWYQKAADAGNTDAKARLQSPAKSQMLGGRGDATYGKDEIQYTNDATRADADAMAKALKNTGYFAGNGVTVVLDKIGKDITLSFVVDPKKVSDPAVQKAFHDLAVGVAKSVSGNLKTVKLVDSQWNELRSMDGSPM
jgi:TPR repeat protein